MVRHLVAPDTKRALDDLGGAVGIVGADCAFEKIGLACTPRTKFSDAIPFRNVNR